MKKYNVFLKILVGSLVLFIILAFSFKKIRAFLPPPEIGNEKLVGFAQYYGYPLNYESFYFLILVFVPLIIFLVLLRRDK